VREASAKTALLAAPNEVPARVARSDALHVFRVGGKYPIAERLPGNPAQKSAERQERGFETKNHLPSGSKYPVILKTNSINNMPKRVPAENAAKKSIITQTSFRPAQSQFHSPMRPPKTIPALGGRPAGALHTQVRRGTNLDATGRIPDGNTDRKTGVPEVFDWVLLPW